MSLPKDVAERNFYVCLAEKRGDTPLYYAHSALTDGSALLWTEYGPDLWQDYASLLTAVRNVPNPAVYGFGAGYVVRIVKIRLQFVEECR